MPLVGAERGVAPVLRDLKRGIERTTPAFPAPHARPQKLHLGTQATLVRMRFLLRI